MQNKNYSHVRRYDCLDKYMIAELKNEYSSRNLREKISFLSKISKNHQGYLPEPLEELAINDDDIVLRRWLVKNISLNTKNAEKFYKDKDELVRAGMYEKQYNSFSHGEELYDFFNKLTLIEKLAFIRNPHVQSELIELLFEYHDKKLKLSPEERWQLVEAYLSNPKETNPNRREYLEYMDIASPASSLNHYRKIWEEIALWPENSPMNFFTVFENLDDYAGVKLDIYKNLKAIHQKNALIQSCNGYGYSDHDLLRLAFNEEEKALRQAAYSKAFLTSKEFEKIVTSNDNDSIMYGLVYNENLTYEQLEKLESKLSDLEDYSGAQQIRTRIEKLKEAQGIEQ